MKIAVSSIYYILRGAFRCFRGLAGRPPTERLTVLYYHGISPQERSGFARQMNRLSRGVHVVPASYRGKLPQGGKCVAITFDDAFISVAANALPELTRHSFHSTIFVPVGWIGQTPAWAMTGDDAAHGEVVNSKLTDRVMSFEQLKALPASLVSLGSHSLSHSSIIELDTEQARAEIEDSRQQLAQLSGREIVEFSFPYGEHDQSAVAMCGAAGYNFAYSIAPQEIDTTTSDLLRGRTKVDPSDGPLEFFLKFSGAYQWTSYTAPWTKALRSLFGKQAPRIRHLAEAAFQGRRSAHPDHG